MGVIERQSIKLTIVKVLGLLIGVISILFVYPLNHETYGYIQFLFGTATLMVPLMGLGFSETIIKYFADYQSTSKSADSFVMLGYVLNVFLFIAIGSFICLFGDWIFDKLRSLGYPLTKVRANIWFLFILSFLINNCILTTKYISNYGRIAIPTALYEVGFKILTPVLVYLVFASTIIKLQVPLLLVGFFSTALGGLIYYAHSIGAIKIGLDFGFMKGGKWKKLLTYSIFSALSSVGAVLAFRVDALMITEKLNETATGLYFNVLMMAAVIDIPSIAMAKIAGPIVSRKWQQGDRANIQDIYTKSSRNALIVGGLVFLGIWFSIDDLLSLSAKPEVFIGASGIFLYLGIAKLVDGATGINNKIISYSEVYKYNLLFLSMLGILNVVMNFIFIDKYGVIGAAIATCISLSIYNIAKLIFIKAKFGLSPFDRNTVIILAVGACTAALVSIAPSIDNVLLSILWKSTLVTTLFAGSIYFLKLSPDINKVVDNSIARLF